MRAAHARSCRRHIAVAERWGGLPAQAMRRRDVWERSNCARPSRTADSFPQYVHGGEIEDSRQASSSTPHTSKRPPQPDVLTSTQRSPRSTGRSQRPGHRTRFARRPLHVTSTTTWSFSPGRCQPAADRRPRLPACEYPRTKVDDASPCASLAREPSSSECRVHQHRSRRSPCASRLRPTSSSMSTSCRFAPRGRDGHAGRAGAAQLGAVSTRASPPSPFTAAATTMTL